MGYIKIFINIIICIPELLRLVKQLETFINARKKKIQAEALNEIKNSTSEEEKNKALEKLTSTF